MSEWIDKEISNVKKEIAFEAECTSEMYAKYYLNLLEALKQAEEALRECQNILSMLTNPNLQNVSTAHLFLQSRIAELKARECLAILAALGKDEMVSGKGE